MMYLVLASLPSHSPTAIFSKGTVIIHRLWGRGSENCWDHMGSWGTEWELGISGCQLPVRGDDKNISETYGGSGKFCRDTNIIRPPPSPPSRRFYEWWPVPKWRVFFLTLVTNLHSFEREILREGGHWSQFAFFRQWEWVRTTELSSKRGSKSLRLRWNENRKRENREKKSRELAKRKESWKKWDSWKRKEFIISTNFCNAAWDAAWQVFRLLKGKHSWRSRDR